MAGWKLRKDKTPAETPDAEVPSPAAASALAEETPVREATDDQTQPETSPAAESSDWLANGWQTHAEAEPITLDEFQPLGEFQPLDQFQPADSDTAAPIALAPQPDFETETSPHFEDDDAPLTLVDYTEPAVPEAAAPEPSVPASVFAMPRLEPSAYESAGEADENDFSHTLRVNRDEMAAAYPSSLLSNEGPSDIPTVAPFVLDTPAPPTEEPLHRLILQVGRLTAPFDITKDVTIIGRPDSALHYYPDVEIVVDDAVSRRHAEILRRDDGCYLTDVGSTNGTLLNGERLAPMEERLLVHGDRIRIGELTEIIFE